MKAGPPWWRGLFAKGPEDNHAWWEGLSLCLSTESPPCGEAWGVGFLQLTRCC